MMKVRKVGFNMIIDIENLVEGDCYLFDGITAQVTFSGIAEARTSQRWHVQGKIISGIYKHPYHNYHEDENYKVEMILKKDNPEYFL